MFTLDKMIDDRRHLTAAEVNTTPFYKSVSKHMPTCFRNSLYSCTVTLDVIFSSEPG